jgi:hypothetical protein
MRAATRYKFIVRFACHPTFNRERRKFVGADETLKI